VLDSFFPPGVQSLAEVDIAAGVRYEDGPAVIQGVVSPESQAATYAAGKGNFKVHLFDLAAWQHSGDSKVNRELVMLRPLPTEAEFLEDFPAYSIQQFSVLLSSDGERAVVEKVLPCGEPSEELLKVVQELQQDVNISTQRFGDLTLNRTINWLEGEAEWNDEAVTICFDAKEYETLEQLLPTAEHLWGDQPKWTELVHNSILDELLDLKNEDWLDEEEEPLSAGEFLARMVLKQISIRAGGEFGFTYRDGDLFEGHWIVAEGEIGTEEINAGIEG
jgi:hypothetical protein